MKPSNSFARVYRSYLEAHLAGSNESILLQAYELGRKAISDGVGVLELAGIHHDALRAITAEKGSIPAEYLEGAAAFFAEIISPFEMMLRGYRESIDRQRLSLEIFTHALAHDLKEPVRTIRSYLDVLTAKENLSEQGKHYVARVQHASDRMQKLIETVYFYTRLEVSEEIAKEPCGLGSILEDAKANLDALIQERKAQIVSGPLPNVTANRTQLLQVLQNLLANAIQHGDDIPTIRVEAEEQSGFWVVRVTDNGPGIAEAQREKVFEPFKRLARKREQGLGLGLAICRKIVEAHGGKISCESAPGGGGSVFSLSLPKASSAKTLGCEAEPAAASLSSAKESPLANLLLVDDNEADIELTQILLLEEANLKCNFLVAHDAYEAMTLLNSDSKGIPPVDVMLLDINMPGMDGLELLNRMRADRAMQRVPVVMCTTSISDQDMKRAKSLGAQGYLTKPAEMARLKPILENVSGVCLHEASNGYELLRAA